MKCAKCEVMRAYVVEWLAMPLPDAGPTQMQELREVIEKHVAHFGGGQTSSVIKNTSYSNYLHVLRLIDKLLKPAPDADIAAGKVESVKTIGQLAGELRTTTAPAEREAVVWAAIAAIQTRVAMLGHPAHLHPGDANTLYGEQGVLRSRVGAIEQRMVEIERDNMVESGQAQPEQPTDDDGKIPGWLQRQRINDRLTDLCDRMDKIEEEQNRPDDGNIPDWRLREIERDNTVASERVQPEQPNPTSTWIAELQQLVSRVERLEGRASRVLGLEGVVKHLDKRVDALEGGEG